MVIELNVVKILYAFYDNDYIIVVIYYIKCIVIIFICQVQYYLCIILNSD